VTESTQQPREAWNEVGRRFEELGRVLRGHFEREPETEPGATGGGTDTAAGDRAAMKDALHRLGQAAQRLGDQAGEAVRDQAVRESAQSVARSFGAALEATFSEFGDEVRERMKARRGGEQADRESAPQPPEGPKELGGQPDAPPAREGDYPPGPSGPS
jgi:hypothetical protein